MAAPTARIIEPDELYAWWVVPRTAMLGPPITPEQVEELRAYIHPDRSIAAFDGSADGRPVGSAGSFPTELTLPGGGSVAAGAVTAVGVLPTHRRQGHLRRFMQTQLTDIAERDEPVAILVAAEYPIYGRFGYGPATEACAVRIDASVPGMWVDEPTGRTELLDNATFTAELLAVYDRTRQLVPGHMSYDDARWKIQTGEITWPDGHHDHRRNATKVVWRDGNRVVQALASYSVKDDWVDNRPRGRLDASLLVAATAEGQREMVRYLTAVDWVAAVHLGTRPNDDAVPLWLQDGRAANLYERSDHVWARILDVPAALSARRYATSARLVLEVDDPLGFAGGRFALEGGPDGATCKTTTEEPDLRIPAKALGSAYLGGYPWARLHAAGWVDETRPGAVESATAMFATPRSPWCAMTF